MLCGEVLASRQPAYQGLHVPIALGCATALRTSWVVGDDGTMNSADSELSPDGTVSTGGGEPADGVGLVRRALRLSSIPGHWLVTVLCLDAVRLVFVRTPIFPQREPWAGLPNHDNRSRAANSAKRADLNVQLLLDSFCGDVVFAEQPVRRRRDAAKVLEVLSSLA